MPDGCLPLHKGAGRLVVDRGQSRQVADQLCREGRLDVSTTLYITNCTNASQSIRAALSGQLVGVVSLDVPLPISGLESTFHGPCAVSTRSEGMPVHV